MKDLVGRLFGPRREAPAALPGEADFLARYRLAFDRVQGAFSFDSAILFMAYHQVLAERGLAGDVLEIGVHHGLSAIAVAALRGDGRRMVAIDLFEGLQDQNVSGSGSGSREIFLRNMRAFHGEIDFLEVIAAPSSTARPEALGSEFSFCHVDGGHSLEETYGDLSLCSSILRPGGILAVDDYFNPSFPGVCEGAVLFWQDRPEALAPLAIAANKVYFQRAPAPFDLNAELERTFPELPHVTAALWRRPVAFFTSGVAAHFDLARSTPRRLAPLKLSLRADLRPEVSRLEASPGATVTLPVRVGNRSTVTFEWSDQPFGLSYHVLARDGRMLRFENARAFFRVPLPPGEETGVDLLVVAPDAPGIYQIEVDVVWEGLAWFKDRRNPTPRVELVVR